MSTENDIEAMETIGDNITIRETICKKIYGDDADHEDYTNDEIIAKLKSLL